jgi:hypothetical protein
MNEIHDDSILTPETNPDHDTVGHKFRSWDGNIYFCDSYDPRIGFWMTDVGNPDNRKNVSERAIGRSYHKLRC